MQPVVPQSSVHLLVNALLIGVSGALLIMVPQEPLQGVVGESVLLPVTYSISHPMNTLRVIWNHQMSIILFSEITMCSNETSALLKVCYEYNIVVGKYQQRVRFFPENASLLLCDLQLSDSGQYTVTFQELNQTRSLTLAVNVPETTHNIPDSTQFSGTESEDPKLLDAAASLAVRYTCAAIFLLIILALHCAWRRQRSQCVAVTERLDEALGLSDPEDYPNGS